MNIMYITITSDKLINISGRVLTPKPYFKRSVTLAEILVIYRAISIYLQLF